MCGSEGGSEAWMESGLYAALLDMVGVHDGLESAHVVMESLSVGVASNSNRMFAFLKLTAPSHFLSSRWNDCD